MATRPHRMDTITKARQATTALLEAHKQLEGCKIAWDRGVAAGIIDATGTDPNAEGYKANDFQGNEGLNKADINQVLGAALTALRDLLNTVNGRKFEDIAL